VVRALSICVTSSIAYLYLFLALYQAEVLAGLVESLLYVISLVVMILCQMHFTVRRSIFHYTLSLLLFFLDDILMSGGKGKPSILSVSLTVQVRDQVLPLATLNPSFSR